MKRLLREYAWILGCVLSVVFLGVPEANADRRAFVKRRMQSSGVLNQLNRAQAKVNEAKRRLDRAAADLRNIGNQLGRPCKWRTRRKCYRKLHCQMHCRLPKIRVCTSHYKCNCKTNFLKITICGTCCGRHEWKCPVKFVKQCSWRTDCRNERYCDLEWGKRLSGTKRAAEDTWNAARRRYNDLKGRLEREANALFNKVDGELKKLSKVRFHRLRQMVAQVKRRANPTDRRLIQRFEREMQNFLNNTVKKILATRVKRRFLEEKRSNPLYRYLEEKMGIPFQPPVHYAGRYRGPGTQQSASHQSREPSARTRRPSRACGVYELRSQNFRWSAPAWTPGLQRAFIRKAIVKFVTSATIVGFTFKKMKAMVSSPQFKGMLGDYRKQIRKFGRPSLSKVQQSFLKKNVLPQVRAIVRGGEYKKLAKEYTFNKTSKRQWSKFAKSAGMLIVLDIGLTASYIVFESDILCNSKHKYFEDYRACFVGHYVNGFKKLIYNAMISVAMTPLDLYFLTPWTVSLTASVIAATGGFASVVLVPMVWITKFFLQGALMEVVETFAYDPYERYWFNPRMKAFWTSAGSAAAVTFGGTKKRRGSGSTNTGSTNTGSSNKHRPGTSSRSGTFSARRTRRIGALGCLTSHPFPYGLGKYCCRKAPHTWGNARFTWGRGYSYSNCRWGHTRCSRGDCGRTRPAPGRCNGRNMKKVALRSLATGRYVYDMGGRAMRASSSRVGAGETFCLLEYGDATVSLYSIRRQRFVYDRGGSSSVTATSGSVGAGEKFQLLSQGGNTVAIWSPRLRKYLRAVGSSLRISARSIGRNEKFTLVFLSQSAQPRPTQAGSGVGPVHLGCYLDRQQRDLSHFTGQRSSTPAACAALCARKGYLYAGLQYRGQCFCGNTYGRYGKRSTRECNTRCNANRNLSCGGSWRNSVYFAGRSLGCYLDKQRRDLAHFTGQRRATPMSCIALCRKRGYGYAGLQYFGQCFCGNTYGRYGKRSARECNTRCHANKRFSCGASWRNNVYKTGAKVRTKTWRAYHSQAIHCSPRGCLRSGPGCNTRSVRGQCSFPRNRARQLCARHPRCKALTCNNSRRDCQARQVTRLSRARGFTSHILR